MPNTTRKIPSYRLHKPTGQAVVRLDGRDFYLGKHGTPSSQEAYHRKVAEWISTGTVVRPDGTANTAPNLSICALILAFWHHAEVYYRHADGSTAGELENLRLALRPLRQLYGSTPARDFGPVALKAVRQSMVDAGLCRRTVNQRVARIVRVIRFGVENELLDPAVHHALKAVPGLRSGRSGARESRVVGPAPAEHVEAARPFLSRQLRAVVDLMQLTGMRSGEALIMRTCDIDRSGTVWTYTPVRHKTEIHGKPRRIFLGPRAQELLWPWLRSDPSAFLFQPREALEQSRIERRRCRKTPLTPSQRSRTRKASPKRVAGERYDARALNHAVARACKKAAVPRWHPHQLRHGVATQLRKEFDLDVARAVLGHSSPAVTELYAEVDTAKAAAAMSRIG